MTKKQLWLGCAWILLVGCGEEDPPGRDDSHGPDAGADDGAVRAGDGALQADDGVVRAGDADVASDGGPKSATPTTWCDVEPITAKNCVPCHKTGGVGPMPLASHADFLQPSADFPGKKLFERAGVRIHDAKDPMPSTGLLESADLAVLDAWIAAGAPPAPAAGCDPVPTAPSDPPPWPTHCDATYRITAHGSGGADAPYVVKPGEEIHPRVDVDAPWGDDEVQAIAFRPITDNEKVLHHWILYGKDRTFLTGWAPGGDGGLARLPDDVGMYMPRGAGSMYLDMHYFNLTGKTSEEDNSGVEVCVLNKEHFRPKTATVARGFGSFGGSDLVLAPAGTKDHEETGKCTVTASQPVHLLTASPHAHTYATHMKFTVKKADGREIVMHDEPFFFHDQKSYALAQDVVLETGDTVITTCAYTNDTNKDVRVGESTTSEMCFNFAVYYPKDALKCGADGAILENF